MSSLIIPVPSPVEFERLELKLWACNFYSQLANALIIEGDYQSSISVLERGQLCATELRFPELEVRKFHVFTCSLHFTTFRSCLVFGMKKW